ncbi:hypothetical protein KRM28CT15_45930 [Krasilnikovia sp. M28-CT-15]
MLAGGAVSIGAGVTLSTDAVAVAGSVFAPMVGAVFGGRVAGARTSFTRAMNARAGTAESSQPDGPGLATASCAARERLAAPMRRARG